MDSDAPPQWRGRENEMIKLSLLYAHYALATLSSVGFGLSTN